MTSVYTFVLAFLVGAPANADLFVAFAQGISFREASRIPQEIDAAAKRKDKSTSIISNFLSGPKPRKTGPANPISLYCSENKPDEKGGGCELSVRAPGETYMTISGPIHRDNVSAKLKAVAAKMAEFDSKKSLDKFEVQGFLSDGDDSIIECGAEQKGAVREWDCSIHVSQDIRSN